MAQIYAATARLLSEPARRVMSSAQRSANCSKQLHLTPIYSYAAIAQLVERIHGKDEVPGSNPGRGSIDYQTAPSGVVFVIISAWHSLVLI